jgi:hypothetical protein
LPELLRKRRGSNWLAAGEHEKQQDRWNADEKLEGVNSTALLSTR